MDDKTRMLVLCNPHNPCGILWDAESLARLAGISGTAFCIIPDEEKRVRYLYTLRAAKASSA